MKYKTNLLNEKHLNQKCLLTDTLNHRNVKSWIFAKNSENNQESIATKDGFTPKNHPEAESSKNLMQMATARKPSMSEKYELMKYTLHGRSDGSQRASRRSFHVKCNETGTKYYCERTACAPDYNPKFLVNALPVDPDAPIKDEWGCQIPREHYGYMDFMYNDSSQLTSRGELWEGWTGMSEGKYRDIKKDIADFLDTFEFGLDDVPVSEIPRTTCLESSPFKI